jgi:hypothetical protein
MMHMNKKTGLIITAALALAIFFGTDGRAHAATMQASSPTGSYQIGDTIRVAVTVSSPSQAINAASGVLSFSTDKLQFISASKTGSIMTIWAEDPAYSASGSTGSVSFEGVVPNPGFTGSNATVLTVTLRAKAAGTATVSFSSASVLANDGMGTNVLTSFSPASYTIGSNPLPIIPSPAAEIAAPSAPLGANAPKIISSTHPDSSKWYANNNPQFSWQLPPDVTGVSELLDKNRTSNPGTTSLGTPSNYAAANLADGVWYLHVRFRDANGWGTTAHYRFQIDTAKPESFVIQQLASGDSKDPRSKFLFVSFDKTSGVHAFDVQIDNAYFLPWNDDGTHTYVTAPLGPGTHTLVAKAYDDAGNFITGTASFIVAGINEPIITEYPPYLQSGSYLLIKGTTYPNVEVDIYVHKTADGNIFTSQPLVFKRTDDLAESVVKVIADSQGAFTYVSPTKLDAGTYEVWAKAVNELGASSTPTQTITIPVRAGAIAKMGIFVINSFILLFILLALILLLAFLLLHGHYKVKHLRERLIRRYFGDDRDTGAGITYLDKDLQKEIVSIQKKIVEKERVTEEEKAFLLKIKKVLSAVEEIVDKDVDGIKGL